VKRVIWRHRKSTPLVGTVNLGWVSDEEIPAPLGTTISISQNVPFGWVDQEMNLELSPRVILRAGKRPIVEENLLVFDLTAIGTPGCERCLPREPRKLYVRPQKTKCILFFWNLLQMTRKRALVLNQSLRGVAT